MNIVRSLHRKYTSMINCSFPAINDTDYLALISKYVILHTAYRKRNENILQSLWFILYYRIYRLLVSAKIEILQCNWATFCMHNLTLELLLYNAIYTASI